jgi:WD40 repeat protein
VFKPHGGVTSAGFSPSGKLIVTGSSDRRVKIWNAATGQVEIQLPAEHSQPVTSAVFSPVDKDERLLLTASEDGTARIWDSSARRELRVLKHHEAKGPIKAVRAAIFSPDGKNVLTACEDATARIWDAASGRPIATLKLDGPALCVAYSADGRRIIVGDANGGAMTFDAQTHRPLVRYLGHTDAINSVAFSPDGLRALTGSADRSAKIWDTVEQDSLADSAQPTAEIKTADSNEPRDGTEILTLKHHDRGVTSVAFSPDGHAVLTTGLDGTAVLWLTEDWQKPLAKK